MANIMDYLDWRGDLPFSVSPVNEVDNYILSKIGCADFTGLVPSGHGSVSIGEAVSAYFARYGAAGDYFGALASASIGPMLRRLPETARFAPLRLSGFVKRLDAAKSEQFSALTLTLPDGTHYVSFRGTDDTLAGWKENFMMSLVNPVPAQTDAQAYLTWAAATHPGPLIIGGHSKGGNLAVFAAATAAEETQARITAVFNNDGPGFDSAFLQTPGYRRIRDRLITVLPQHAIVGTLLTQETRLTIVRSDRAGFAAHDGFHWQVQGTAFVRCGALSPGSQAFDATMDDLLSRMNQAQRQEFIEKFFDLLSASGATTLTDITAHKLHSVLEIGRGLWHERDVQGFAWDVTERMVRQLLGTGRHTVRAVRPRKRKGGTGGADGLPAPREDTQQSVF